jgi:DNA-binding MarR family transcriptional regulator
MITLLTKANYLSIASLHQNLYKSTYKSIHYWCTLVSNNGNGQKIKEDIINILKYHPEGLTAQELSKIIGAHRHTVTKYILVLEEAGLIYRRRVGSATLHYLKNNYNGESSKVAK